MTGSSQIRLLLTPLVGPWLGVVVESDRVWCLGESLDGTEVNKHLMSSVRGTGKGWGEQGA